MTDRVYDDERAMNIIASALMDNLPPEEFIEHVREIVEMTGRDPDTPYESDPLNRIG